MDISEILHELEENRGYFPEAAVGAAVARREEMIPHLLQILEDVVGDPAAFVDRDAYFAHIYALYLLAQFRVTAAYPLVIRYARLDPRSLHTLSGELFTGDFYRILASVYDGDIAPIKALIEDPAVDEYARGAALQTLTALLRNDRIRRDELVAYFGHLLRGGLPRDRSFDFGNLVCSVTDIHPGELMPDIRKAYEEGLVAPLYVSLREVETAAEASPDEALAALRECEGRLIEDTVADMHWWACFQPEEDDDLDPNLSREDGIDDAPLGSALDELPPPYVRESPKVGRNDPCPCGSGKKFKKCCGA